MPELRRGMSYPAGMILPWISARPGTSSTRRERRPDRTRRSTRHWLTTWLTFTQQDILASRAFDRISGVEHAFYDALDARGRGDPGPADMGEDFDFDDDQQMRRRLPRLAALCLGPGSGQ